MNIPCFLKEIDGQQFNIAFSSIEDMELFIIKVRHENAKQEQLHQPEIGNDEGKI